MNVSNNYKVRFTYNGSIKKVLGFTADAYESGVHYSENFEYIVKILAINTIFD